MVEHCEGKVPNNSIFFFGVDELTCSSFVVNQDQWNIVDDPKDKIKGVSLKIMNEAWKQFKSRLKTVYMDQGKDPLPVYPWLTQEVWEEFQALKKTKEFKVCKFR